MPQIRDTLLELAAFLEQSDYAFICPTPESQERVMTKRKRHPKTRYSESLQDVFGWSLDASKSVLISLLSCLF